MKTIINNKLYDTETADLMFEFRRKVKGQTVLWNPDYCYVDRHDIEMYKTKKGSYFEYDKTSGMISVSSEERVKTILQTINPDKYIEVFGNVEEA